MTTTAQEAAWHTASEFNQRYPSGTPVLAWPGTRDEEPLRTRTRDSAWALPSGAAVVSVVGHAGGIALTHIEHDPTRQPAVPDIEFECPPCPICGVGLDTDGDSFTCYPCGASWDTNGTGGRWDDPSALRCLASVNPYPRIDREVVEYCARARNHDLRDRGDSHRSTDGLTGWSDTFTGALTDGSGEAL